MIRYHTRCYFNVRTKADVSHGTQQLESDKKVKSKNEEKLKKSKLATTCLFNTISEILYTYYTGRHRATCRTPSARSLRVIGRSHRAGTGDDTYNSGRPRLRRRRTAHLKRSCPTRSVAAHLYPLFYSKRSLKTHFYASPKFF